MNERNNKKYIGGVASKKTIQKGVIKNRIVDETFNNISNLNVNRGEIKGFIFENLHAKDLNYKLYKKGLKAVVVDDNGIADILIKDIKTGKVVEKIQAKCGYEKLSTTKDLIKYIDDGQKLVINNDANGFKKLLERNNIPYEQSNITNKEVSKMATTMKKEGKYLNKNNAKISTSLYKSKEVLKNCHNSGISGAKSGAIFGAGVSLGSNIVEVINGDKDLEEAAIDIAKDTTIAGVSGYVVGAAGTALASTTVGGAVITGATAVGSAVASTAIGGAAIGATTAITGTAIGTATAVSGAIATGATAVGSAVASTAIGGAVVTGATAVGGAIAGTAIGGAAIAGAAAIGTVAVAAAPVVAVGAIIGGGCTLIRKIFGD